MGNETVRIAVDAMGGDHAPEEIVRGAVQASRDSGVEVILVGDVPRLKPLVEAEGGASCRLVHAAETVAMDDDHPAERVRRGSATSVAAAVQLVKDGEADGMVSAGSTGAVVAAALLRLGRVPGVSRPALCSPMPTISGFCFIIDAGANVNCRPHQLVQFAEMGSIYARQALGVEKPRVGLLNVGEEPTKGSDMAVEAHRLLRASPHIHFIGNVEGRDISWGHVDVVVCDGFIGNIVLKFAEGMGTAMLSLMRDELRKSWRSTIGAALARPAFMRMKKRLDYSEYGGVPLLGVNGVVIVSHGSSNAKAVANAVRAAVATVREKTPALIAETMARHDRAVT